MIIIFGNISLSINSSISTALSFEKENHTSHNTTNIGGHAALQAIAASRAGAKTSLCGTIGNDIFGKTILNTLRREGINTASIALSEKEPTGQKITVACQSTQPLIINTLGANKYSNSTQLPSKVFNERTLLLLQDEIPHKTNIEITKRAQSNGGKVIITLTNTEKENSELIELADMVIDKENVKAQGFNCFCGTLAACLQAGMEQDMATHYAQTAGTLAAKKGGGYDSLPYLDDIEKNL